MATLQQILEQQRLFQSQLENYLMDVEDEPNLEAIIKLWEVNSCELEAKINAYGHTIRKIENTANYYREQAKYFSDKAKRVMSQAVFLESRLMAFVSEQPNQKFTTLDFNLKVVHNPASVEIDDTYEGDIPDEFIKEQKPSAYLSKTAIKEYIIRNGDVLPFAKLVRNKGIRGL